ncbi:hypothetical protein U1Q18_030075 [Sarracenia purpurea var. burkii]
MEKTNRRSSLWFKSRHATDLDLVQAAKGGGGAANRSSNKGGGAANKTLVRKKWRSRIEREIGGKGKRRRREKGKRMIGGKGETAPEGEGEEDDRRWLETAGVGAEALDEATVKLIAIWKSENREVKGKHLFICEK